MQQRRCSCVLCYWLGWVLRRHSFWGGCAVTLFCVLMCGSVGRRSNEMAANLLGMDKKSNDFGCNLALLKDILCLRARSVCLSFSLCLSHSSLCLSLSQPVCRSVYLPCYVPLYVCLSNYSLPVSSPLSLSFSATLPVSLSLCLSGGLCMSCYVPLYVCLSNYSLSLSICLTMSVSLSH